MSKFYYFGMIFLFSSIQKIENKNVNLDRQALVDSTMLILAKNKEKLLKQDIKIRQENLNKSIDSVQQLINPQKLER